MNPQVSSGKLLQLALFGYLSLSILSPASADKRPSSTASASDSSSGQTTVWGLPGPSSNSDEVLSRTLSTLEPLPLELNNNADYSYSSLSSQQPSIVTLVQRPSRRRTVYASTRPSVSYGLPAVVRSRQETVVLPDVRPSLVLPNAVVRTSSGVRHEGDDSGERQRIHHHHEDTNMPYTFAWSVRDDEGNDYGHQETRSDSGVTSGGYRVLLPDGRLQIVEYKDDGWGYEAQVRYEGEARFDDVVSSSSSRGQDDSYRVVQQVVSRAPLPVLAEQQRTSVPITAVYGAPKFDISSNQEGAIDGFSTTTDADGGVIEGSAF